MFAACGGKCHFVVWDFAKVACLADKDIRPVFSRNHESPCVARDTRAQVDHTCRSTCTEFMHSKKTQSPRITRDTGAHVEQRKMHESLRRARTRAEYAKSKLRERTTNKRRERTRTSALVRANSREKTSMNDQEGHARTK